MKSLLALSVATLVSGALAIIGNATAFAPGVTSPVSMHDVTTTVEIIHDRASPDRLRYMGFNTKEYYDRIIDQGFQMALSKVRAPTSKRSIVDLYIVYRKYSMPILRNSARIHIDWKFPVSGK